MGQLVVHDYCSNFNRIASGVSELVCIRLSSDRASRGSRQVSAPVRHRLDASASILGSGARMEMTGGKGEGQRSQQNVASLRIDFYRHSRQQYRWNNSDHHVKGSGSDWAPAR